MINIEELHKRTERLFEKRGFLTSLWQEIADNFYPERADFTTTRSLGQEFADHLDTSYPIIVRRDLGNAFSAMLRPAGKPWFEMTTDDPTKLDHDSKAWLQWASQTQRRAMYDNVARFVRATKEGDHDFGAFGQCVLSVQVVVTEAGQQLVYNCWHLRDVVWCEDDLGSIDTVVRKCKMAAKDIIRKWPKTVPQPVKSASEKDPYAEFDVYHYVCKADYIDEPNRAGHPWHECYYLADGSHTCLEKTHARVNPYVIPRWQTVSGSQYAFSPATVAGLADARMLQAMSATLLRAGEKFTDPPMIAVQQAIRGDIGMYPGAITWVDAEYDEKMGEVLRPLSQDKSGMPIGIEMQRDSRALLAECFYLNKITMPPNPDHQMTAYEASQRVNEYIRQALPLFEPMETDYNGALCDRTFELMMNHHGFGPVDTIPRALRGQNLRFRFQTPLQAAQETVKGATLKQARELLATVADLDPASTTILDARTALRDALEGIGVPTRWTRSQADVEKVARQQQAAQAQQSALAKTQQASEIAKNFAQAQAAAPVTL